MRLIVEVRPLSTREVLIRTRLPSRSEGYTAEEILAAWKKEVLALKQGQAELLRNANLYFSGPMTLHMAAYAVEALRAAARNIFIQAADTGDFLRVSGIDSDAQVQAALGRIGDALTAAVPSRTWRAICLKCRHVWEAVGPEPRFCPQCRSAEIAAREITETEKGGAA